MASNNFCALDNQNPTKFCVCRDSVTVLCDRCVPLHEKQHYGDLHDYNPIAYLDIMYQLGLDGFRMQKMQVLNGAAFVRKLQEAEDRQYTDAKRRMEEAVKKYSEWLDYLHRCFLSLIEKFNQEKFLPLTSTQFQFSPFSYSVFALGVSTFPTDSQLIETAPLQQFESSIGELQVRLQQCCGRLQNFEEYYISSIQTGANSDAGMNAPSLPAVAPSQNYASQYAYQVASPYVASLAPRQSVPTPAQSPANRPVPSAFRLYVPFTRGKLFAKWMSDTTELDKVILSRSLDFTNVTVSVVLPDGNLFSCGGRDAHEYRAVQINTTTGDVTLFPEMKKGRGNPGIVYVDGVVFVFGGFISGSETNHTTGEKFVFQQNQWIELRNKMANSRFQFTPCANGRTIYLAGGWHTTSVEAFDIPTEAFSTLPLILPKNFGTTCFVYNNELIVLQDHRLIRWKLNSRTGDYQSQSLDVSVKDSNVSVQVNGSKAYYSSEQKDKCDVHRLDLQTWVVTEVANLSNSSSGGERVPCPVS